MNKNFEISTYFYPSGIINQAIIDFNEVAQISIQDNILTISWNDENEINNIFNEFINYVIWLINEL